MKGRCCEKTTAAASSSKEAALARGVAMARGHGECAKLLELVEQAASESGELAELLRSGGKGWEGIQVPNRAACDVLLKAGSVRSAKFSGPGSKAARQGS